DDEVLVGEVRIEKGRPEPWPCSASSEVISVCVAWRSGWSRSMAVDPEMHDELPEKSLRKQLAATVRTIQWSYAIFWSTSTRQPGVLAWSDGYYNGDIKTRKTTQPVELKADQMGLQRSEQLRELYESLSAGDSNQQMRRPCASLSPEDLTHTEWYYLVCMSFTFTLGQGYIHPPPKTLDLVLSSSGTSPSKLFAAAAAPQIARFGSSNGRLSVPLSLQTVACIPFMGGVLELGTTESVSSDHLFLRTISAKSLRTEGTNVSSGLTLLVLKILEDAAVVTQITSFFWELPCPVCSEQSMSSPQMADDDGDDDDDDDDGDDVGNSMALEDQNLITDHPRRCPFALHSFAPPSEQREAVHDKADELCDCSPGDSFHTQQLEDMLEIDGLNCVPQTQNRQFRDDELISLNSNEYASMSVVHAKRVASSAMGERTRHPMPDNSKHVLLDLDAGDSHYANTVATILRSSKPVRSVSCFLKVSGKSSFMGWRRGMSTPKPFTGTPQKLLKKMLMDGEWLRGGHQPKRQEGNEPKAWRPGESGSGHVLSERKLTEKFLVLQSLIPSVAKVVIRLLELESCRESSLELDAKNRRKHPDVAERTSDNYGSKEMMVNARKSCSNKRKTCDAGETEAEYHWVLSRDGPIDVIVTMKEEEVAVEIHCPWRECLLLEIVESISNFHLDPLSVQSSTVDGVLALTVKSKVRIHEPKTHTTIQKRHCCLTGNDQAIASKSDRQMPVTI
ncbi:hypothetical protein BHE74_00041512, partial [Ensete ventricosum]